MKKVLLLLAGGFEMYEASAFIDVIGWNLAEGDGTTKLATCGMSGRVKSSFDQSVNVDLTVDEAVAGDYEALAIPGGFEAYGFYTDAYSDKFLELIKQFYIMNKVIASVCVGALPLGKSGILKGKRGTTYAGERRDQLRSFGVEVADEPIVVDGSIITSWDPSTAVDVALLALELLTSPEQALRVRTMMGFC